VRWRAAVGAAFWLAAASPAMVVAQPACSGLPALTPELEVTADPGGEPEVRAASAEEIRRKAAEMGRDPDPPGRVTRGLTTVEIRVETGFTLARIEDADGTVCVALEAARVELANRDVAVLIDRRYEKGSCEHRAVLAHELEHVAINAEAVRAGERRLRERLEAVVSRWKGRWVPEERQAAIGDALQGAASAVLAEVRRSAAARHARIDTPQSYAETQRRCQSW
jgi:hypothetical protein